MLLYPTGANRFITEAGTYATHSSRRGVRATLAKLQAAHPGQSISGFTERQLVAFCNEKVRGGMPAPNTVKTRRTQVRSFFGWAAYVGLIPRDPAASLKYAVRPSGNNVREGLWLTEQQVAAVVGSHPEPDSPAGQREKLILLAGFTAGLRLSEISLAMRRQSVSADGGTLRFVGKGRKLATVGLPAQLAEAIRSSESPTGNLLPLIYPPYVVWERQLGAAAIRKVVQAAGRRVGFDLDPHDMRRSYAGILEAKGLDIRDISKLLRHESVATTERYLESNPAKVTALGQSLSFAL